VKKAALYSSVVLVALAATASAGGAILMATGEAGSGGEWLGACLALGALLAVPALAVLARRVGAGWRWAFLTLGFVLLAGAAPGGHVVWRWRSRPNFDRDGGVLLTYEIDAEGSPPGSYQVDVLLDRIRRRIDPTGLGGVEVRSPGAGRVEIAIPRAGPDEVEGAKLALSLGRLELRIVANNTDDNAAISAARDQLKTFKAVPPAMQERLRKSEAAAQPPPAPRNDGGGLTFPCALPDEPDHTYSWVELGKSQLYALELNGDALKRHREMADAEKRAAAELSLKRALDEAAAPEERDRVEAELFRIEQHVRRAREIDEALAAGGGTFQEYGNLYYVRKITSWTRRSERDRKLGKEVEFFVLARDPIKGQEITGDHTIKANPGTNARGELCIDFGLSDLGGDLFYDLTKRNRPTGGDPRTSFKRQIAILFNNQVISAPILYEPIRTQGQISGNFTEAEVNYLVRALRVGALPARLLPLPVSEVTVGPKR
jgi:preprotein translocase subunit SecD